MRATGTLPSEQRAKDMNDVQWLWYYMNIMKDEEETHDRFENYMDYMGSWFNPQLAKSVMEQKRKKKNKQKQYIQEETGINPELDPNLTYAETAVSSDFDDEFKRAIAGENGNVEVTELPSSDGVGDPNEDPEDFLSRVQGFEHLVDTNPFKPEVTNMADLIDPVALNNATLDDIGKLIPNVLNIDDLDYFDEE